MSRGTCPRGRVSSSAAGFFQPTGSCPSSVIPNGRAMALPTHGPPLPPEKSAARLADTEHGDSSHFPRAAPTANPRACHSAVFVLVTSLASVLDYADRVEAEGTLS